MQHPSAAWISVYPELYEPALHTQCNLRVGLRVYALGMLMIDIHRGYLKAM